MSLGFNYNGKNPEPARQQPIEVPKDGAEGLQEALRITGIHKAWELFMQYTNTKEHWPYVQGELRDKLLANKLAKIRERFFEPL